MIRIFLCAALALRASSLSSSSLPLANSTYLVFDSNISVPGARQPVSCYRIPAIVQGAQALLAFAEAREGSCGDCVVNGIAMRRSTDGGRTWGPYQWAVSDHSTDASRPHMDIGGNPSAVYDDATGKILLQFVRGNAYEKKGQICNPATSNWQIESLDDGLTWSRPVEITSYLGKYHGSLVGPANGIKLKHNAAHKGRLIWCGHWGVYNSTQVWFSDDGGRTYNLSASVFSYMDECTLAELSDGRVYLNMRNNHIKNLPHASSCNCRAFATSTDGGASFGDISFDEALISPVCQATLSSAGGHLLFANPASPRSRMQGAIRKSVDMGKTWPYTLQVTPVGLSILEGGSYDYSCLVPDPLNDDTSKGGLLWSHLEVGHRCDQNPAPAACWKMLFTRFDLNFGSSLII